MENNYSVAISCHSDLGYIEYTADTKSANIVLANEVAKQKVEEFLNTPLTLQVPHETLHDFTTITINPLDDVETLQLALTRLWEVTDVHVDWSRPVDYVKNGISICIFPEGTRNNGEELSMLPFRDGALKIAEKTGCAIIPISMNNTADIFEAHFPRVKKVHVVIEYGKPIYPKELDKETRKHLGIYCHDLIQDTIKKNASLI